MCQAKFVQSESTLLIDYLQKFIVKNDRTICNILKLSLKNYQTSYASFTKIHPVKLFKKTDFS